MNKIFLSGLVILILGLAPLLQSQTGGSSPALSSDFDSDGLTYAQETDAVGVSQGLKPFGEWNDQLIELPAGYSFLPGNFNSVLESNRFGDVLVTARKSGFRGLVGLYYNGWMWREIKDGSSSTIVTDLNDWGKIAGRSSGKGFIWDPNSPADYSIFTLPDGVPAFPERLNNYGDTVGAYQSVGYPRFAVWDDSLIESPRATYGGMEAWRDVNNFGEFLLEEPFLVSDLSYNGTQYLPEFVRRHHSGQYSTLFIPANNYFFSAGLYNYTSGTNPFDGNLTTSWFNSLVYQYNAHGGSNSSLSVNDWGEFTGRFSLSPTSFGSSGISYGPDVAWGYYYFDGANHSLAHRPLDIDNDPSLLLDLGGYFSSTKGALGFMSDGYTVHVYDLLQWQTIAPTPLPPDAKLGTSGIVAIALSGENAVLLVSRRQDDDGDGMSNDWENYYFGAAAVSDSSNAAEDPDGDGYSNSREYRFRSNPLQPDAIDPATNRPIDVRPGIDTDGDGIPNSYEVANGLNYLVADDLSQDLDGDGISNWGEFQAGTSAASVDTDGDGRSDGDEARAGTDPNNPDTDGDGIPDGAEEQEPVLVVQHLGSGFAKVVDGSEEPVRQYWFETVSKPALLTEPFPSTQELSSSLDYQQLYARHASLAPSIENHWLRAADGQSIPGWNSTTLPEIADFEFHISAGALYAQVLGLLRYPLAASFQGQGPPGGNNHTEGRATNARAVVDKATFSTQMCQAWLNENALEERSLRYLRLTFTTPHRGEDHPAGPWPTDLKHWTSVPGESGPVILTIPKGQKHSEPYLLKAPRQTNTHVVSFLLPVELITDMNNDGEINSDDNALRDAAFESEVTDEEKDKGTEFLFVNYKISNGLGDVEDGKAPAGTTDDDDIQEIKVTLDVKFGTVDFDHPAIERLKFFEDKPCEDQVEFPFDLAANDLPEVLYIRTEGEFDGQVEGDLVLKYKPKADAEEIEAVKLKLTVVHRVGDKKYFYAARDYMKELNSKLCVRQEKTDKNGRAGYWRLITMLHEKTSMKTVDSYHRDPKLKGIGAVVGSYGSYDVAVNGNFCHSSSPPLWAKLAKVRVPEKGGMTDRCDGIFITGKNKSIVGISDNGNGLAGPKAEYIGYNEADLISISTGHVPIDPIIHDEALGGFSARYVGGANSAWHPWYGIAEVGQKKVFFVATPYIIPIPGGGGSADLKQRLIKSGVPNLPGGDPGEIMCVSGDGGSSIGLAYRLNGQALKVTTEGGKHKAAVELRRQQGDYFINTYLLFKTQKTR